MSQIAEDSTVAELESLWPGSLPAEERLQFIAWETQQRETALSRLRAIRAHVDGSAAPTALMEKLQIGKSQFYNLVRDWGKRSTLSCLVPHARKRSSPSRTNPEVLSIVEKAIAENGGENSKSEAKLVALIQQRANDKGIKAPAASTIRRLILKAAMASPGALRGDNNVSHDALGFDSVFGGQLLVDHSTVDLLCCSKGQVIRPTISVVVDNATKIILAAKLSDHIPRPCDFVATLAQAFVGYAHLREDGLSAISGLHPVLTMRTGNSLEWTYLRDLARQSRFKFDIRRAPTPVFGHVLRRSMIVRIGRYQLLPRSTMREPQARVRDNEKDSNIELSLADAQKLIDLAVRVHNRERLKIVPAAAVLGSPKLRLNTERVDWLEFGLAIFKDAVTTLP